MWLVVAREPVPDAPYWPGRRWLAVVDAVAWPAAWVVLFAQLPAPPGVVGPIIVAIASISCVTRVSRAVWQNHRYRFTAWRWGRVIAALLLTGLVLKLMVS